LDVVTLSEVVKDETLRVVEGVKTGIAIYLWHAERRHRVPRQSSEEDWVLERSSWRLNIADDFLPFLAVKRWIFLGDQSRIVREAD